MKEGVLIICKVAIHGPMEWLKKASSFDCEYSIETKDIFSFLIPMFSSKANMMFLYFSFLFYINHIAICICNSLKCWVKHPLPYWTRTSLSLLDGGNTRHLNSYCIHTSWYHILDEDQ